MDDYISRQAALDIFDDYNVAVESGQIEAYSRDRKRLCDLPPAQLGTNLAEVGRDTISRQAIDKFIDGLEEIFADLREQHVDDSVCGLCEYDGAYIGQSGDWCNECPGFDKDDCFKLSDKTRKEWTEEIIKALPPSQPEPCEDAVSREEVLNCLEWQYPDKLPRTKIMELPHVIPKQRTWRWNDCDPICPACGEDKFKDLDADIWADWKPKFCPNCGAKMEGVAE